MLPITNPPKAPREPVSRSRPVVRRPAAASGRTCSDRVPCEGSEAREPLEPIGPDRLRALREAIENGTYPTEADVLGGLERLFEIDDD